MKGLKIKQGLGIFTVALAALCMQSPTALWAKSTESKIKSLIDNIADELKKGIDQVGNDLAAIQKYLDHYHWKGMLEKQASSGPATLSDLKLNGHSRVVAVNPGERIEADVRCTYDANQCSTFSYYRVVVGLKGVGGITTIGNTIGSAAGDTIQRFAFTAPTVPGFYQVRFRTVEKWTETEALKEWINPSAQEPDATTTIGIIYVKNPA